MDKLLPHSETITLAQNQSEFNLHSSGFQLNDGQFEYERKSESQVSDYDQPIQENLHILSEQEEKMKQRLEEEEQKVLQLIREKARKQCEEKQRRREIAKSQLQEFFNQKDQQKEERKAENRRKEKICKMQKESGRGEGWKKVQANIQLKEGADKERKEIGRMRQAIKGKINDEQKGW